MRGGFGLRQSCYDPIVTAATLTCNVVVFQQRLRYNILLSLVPDRWPNAPILRAQRHTTLKAPILGPEPIIGGPNVWEPNIRAANMEAPAFGSQYAGPPYLGPQCLGTQ